MRIKGAPTALRHLVLLLLAWLIVSTPVWGGEQVLVVGDTSRGYVRSFVDSLKDGLSRNGIALSVSEPTTLDASPGKFSGYSCIVTIGHEAALVVSGKAASTPVLHTLVTESLADELDKEHPSASPHLTLLIEQPISRLLMLAKTTIPRNGRVGVLYGPTSVNKQESVRREAGRIGVKLLEREVHGETGISEAIKFFQGNADILITLPDAQVINEGTVKTLILGAYHDNLPLAGYSQALVKAGAMMAVYTTPEQFGRQTAELINNQFWKNPALSNARIYPRYFQVSVNYQVARALGVELPDESRLEAQIRNEERKQ